MNNDIFIKSASKLGYSTKKQAEKYCTLFPKEEYTDDDYISLHRWVQNSEECRIRGMRSIYGCNGLSTKHYKNIGGDGTEDKDD